MQSLWKSTAVMFWPLTAAIWAMTAVGAAAQAPATADDAKLQRCRQNASALHWLTREQVRERCGLWSKSYTVKSASGPVERLVYSRYFVVTLRNGQVSTIRQRRQFFTGFRKSR
jgi:hypothetical protein